MEIEKAKSRHPIRSRPLHARGPGRLTRKAKIVLGAVEVVVRGRHPS